jgi:TolA-binding protein
VATADDRHKTDDAWKDAEGYWKEYIDAYPDRPGAASARRLRGEVQALRGQTKEAVETWKNVSAPMTPLEKLASLWLAKQLAERKQPG